MPERQLVKGRWSSAEDASLKAALKAATTWSEVARALGRSCGSVRDRAYLLARRGEITRDTWASVTRNKNARRRWTAARLASLHGYAAAGVSTAEAAKRLDVSPSALRKAARTYGISFPKGVVTYDGRRFAKNAESAWQPFEDERLMQLFAMRWPSDQIAADLGRSVFAVRKRLNRLGMAFHRKWTEEQDLRLRGHCAAGLQVAEIARKMNVSYQTVYRHMSRLGLHLMESPQD